MILLGNPPGTPLQIQDEGVPAGTVTTLNFTGASVTASVVGSTATITVSGGSSSWTEVTVNFGARPIYDATFTITDAAITSTSKVIVLPSGKAAAGRTADDWQWDGATFAANPGTGSATVYAVFSPGPIVGNRTLHYAVR